MKYLIVRTGAALVTAGALLAGPAWTASAQAVSSTTVSSTTVSSTTGPLRISTIAGGFGAGPASQVASFANCAVGFRAGDLYTTQRGLIRRISLRTGLMDTQVGADPGPGPLATKTGIGYSCGIAFDRHGNLIFPDGTYWSGSAPEGGNNQVRVDAAASGTFYGQSMKAGHVYTIAGTGAAGFSGNGGSATAALLNSPGGVAVDQAGNVIVTDFGNDVVRIIAARTGTFYGQAMTAGDIYPLAGDGTFGDTGDGGLATAAELAVMPQDDGKEMVSFPWPDVTVDAHGNVVLADVNNGQIRVVASENGTFYGTAMTAGHIYKISSVSFTVSGVALDHAGNIVVADPYNELIDVVAASTGTFYGQHMKADHLYTIAGNGNPGLAVQGVPALKAEFSGPVGLAVDSAGNVVIADTGGWDPNDVWDNELLRVLATRTGRFYGISMKAGDVYAISGLRGQAYYGDGVPATSALLLGGGLTTTRSGSVIFADSGNERVRMVASKSGNFYARKMISGDIYTISARGWHNPADVAVDASGNVLVTDRFNDQVKVIAAKAGRFYGRALRAGQVVVIAGVGKAGYGGDGGLATKAKLNQPSGIALDHSGNIVITDSFNGRVRVIAVKAGRFYGKTMRAGHIYTVARLACYWVAVDASGNLVLADQFFLRVLAERSGPFYGIKMVPGLVYTIAGGGPAGSPGDGGPATSAYVAPNGIAFDAAGNILIADSRNNRIRVIAVKSGSFYGQAMKAQDIYTIAGGGPAGLNDGGRAIAAGLNFPTGVAVGPGGSILFTDVPRIRRIAVFPG